MWATVSTGSDPPDGVSTTRHLFGASRRGWDHLAESRASVIGDDDRDRRDLDGPYSHAVALAGRRVALVHLCQANAK